MKEIKFKTHNIIWNNEKIINIWDFYSKHDNDYFSLTNGDAILKLVKKRIPLKGKILDFGCGTGNLIEKLLKKNIYSAGFDLSKKSVDIVNKKFKLHPYFLGCFHSTTFPTTLSSYSYDVIFFIETIEHLLPDQKDIIFQEINRILKKEVTL